MMLTRDMSGPLGIFGGLVEWTVVIWTLFNGLVNFLTIFFNKKKLFFLIFLVENGK
jgi:hypothetical protein